MESMRYAYKNFDKIVTVRNGCFKGMPSAYSKKTVTVHNINDSAGIIRMAQDEISLDSDSYCTVPLSTLKNLLADGNTVKFINIARYSMEKGQDRLISAFDMLSRRYKNTCLIIIGGHGDRFDYINELVEKRACKNIILIRSLSNPFPILAACDCFVLSSHYEGLPMTIMEALILKKKVISTDIEGVSDFLRQEKCGLLVENSANGIMRGMEEYMKTGISQTGDFDSDGFNLNAQAEWESLFEEEHAVNVAAEKQAPAHK